MSKYMKKAIGLVTLVGLCLVCLQVSARAGEFDINGDGEPDLLWQSRFSGDVYHWLMAYNPNDTTSGDVNYYAINQAYYYDFTLGDTNWKIVGTPDINGDGVPDILWQNRATGQVYWWPMQYDSNDGTYEPIDGDYSYVTQLPPNWKIVGTTDIDGDGIPDILWWNQDTGDVYFWPMGFDGDLGYHDYTGAFYYVGTVDPSWQIVGVPDVNSDGVPDLLWWNQDSGMVYYWPMQYNSGDSQPYSLTGFFPLTQLSTNYTIEGTSYIDDSGVPGIVWKNTDTGDFWWWSMSWDNTNGYTYNNYYYIGTEDPAWDIVGLKV